MRVAELRDVLGQRFPGAQPLVYRTVGAVATGIGALDRFLPNGGIPRGRLTVWRPGGGATAVLRAASRAVVWGGERAVWIDADGVATGDFWPGALLIRPDGAGAGYACAEEVLRSGGFALVVLAGAGRGLNRVVGRLVRAVREGGGAFLVTSEETAHAPLRVVSRIVPDATTWSRNAFGEPVAMESVLMEVEASALGWSGRTRFRLPVLERSARDALDPLLVDRRGVPHRAGHWSGRTARAGMIRAKREERARDRGGASVGIAPSRGANATDSPAPDPRVVCAKDTGVSSDRDLGARASRVA